MDSTVPPVPLPNPLANLGSVDLFNLGLVLNLGCGRNKWVLKGPQKKLLCYASELLALESARRTEPYATAPFHVGQFKSD
jgi:hypothetical protein